MKQRGTLGTRLETSREIPSRNVGNKTSSWNMFVRRKIFSNKSQGTVFVDGLYFSSRTFIDTPALEEIDETELGSGHIWALFFPLF